MIRMQAFRPVPHTRVTLTDAFWAPRIEVNRTATLPHVRQQLEATGRLAALDLAWRIGMPNKPHHFWDSDIAKWLEAASLSLAAHPDPALEADLDMIIERYANLQHPSGYLNSYFLGIDPSRRWANLRDAHELYCVGHLIEAAVAHHAATGKRTFLEVMCRAADHVCAEFGWGRDQRRGYPGHEEIELALVKLAAATGERRYFEQARYFIDARGQQPHYYEIEARLRGDDPRAYWAKTYEYVQAHVPLREQTTVVGHAVRAMYLYAGATDVAAATGDTGLLAVLEGLWQQLVDTRLFVTGGIGTSGDNEGFTRDYDLPDEDAYAETCAAIGLVFWAQRMLATTGQGQYADMLERALYNGVLSGVGLDGTRFFYENPLASGGQHAREAWYSCACCPPNIARLLAGLPGLFLGSSDDSVWMHLYAQGRASVPVAAGVLSLSTQSCYPWDGAVGVTVEAAPGAPLALRLRIPGWCVRWRVRVNGAPLESAVLENGYLVLRRVWRAGDRIDLQLGMPVRFTYPHPRIRALAGRVAVERGPLVYCLEGVDQRERDLELLALDTSAGPAAFKPHHDHHLLGGVTLLRGPARRLGAAGGLYRSRPLSGDVTDATLIPYAVWANRARTEMRVWGRST